MADHDQRGAGLLSLLEQEIEKCSLMILVKRGGRLVGDYDRRIADEGTRNRNALLLTDTERRCSAAVQRGIEPQSDEETLRLLDRVAVARRA